MKKGFTLIELLVVVLIIGILSAIALPQYTTAVEKARSSEAITLMGTLRYAAERYRLQTGYWPDSNDFESLDIEMPKYTPTGSSTASYGTKNFSLTTTGGKTATNYVNTFTRRSGNVYNLITTVNTDGTAKRTCTGDEALCNAITAGHATDGEW